MSFYTVSASTPAGSTLLNAINQFAGSVATLQTIQARMANMIVNGTNYAQIETQYGIATGNGQPVYNLLCALVSNANAPCTNAALPNFTNQVGTG